MDDYRAACLPNALCGLYMPGLGGLGSACSFGLPGMSECVILGLDEFGGELYVASGYKDQYDC